MVDVSLQLEVQEVPGHTDGHGASQGRVGEELTTAQMPEFSEGGCRVAALQPTLNPWSLMQTKHRS